MWIVFALLSAIFAALTSILAKIGIEGVDSNLVTAIRTVVVFGMAWIMVFITYPDTFKCIGETDIDKTCEMPKSVVTYRKPRRISDERRSQLQKIMGNINKL